MRTLICTTLLALALPLGAGIARAEDPKGAGADQALIEALIQQLGADDFRSRESASEKLARLGERARPALEQASKESKSPEVRWRADQLLQQLKPAGERPLGADGAGPDAGRPGEALPEPSPSPLDPRGHGLGQEMADRIAKLMEQLKSRRGSPFAGGLFASPRLEAPGLVLERLTSGQVQLKVKRDAKPGEAAVDDLYVGRSLAEILEAHPELSEHAGMEALKREEAKQSWPGIDEFFKRGPGIRVQPFPGGSGFGMTSSSGVSISQDADGVTVKITERDEDGKEVTKTYTGASLDEVKKEHPEIADKLDGFGFSVRVVPPNFFWPDQSKRRLEPFGTPTTPRSAPGRALFGLRLEGPDPALASQMRLQQGQGAIVRSVTPGSPAARIGFEVNDIILEIGGIAVDVDQAVATLRAAASGNEPLTVLILRKGEKRTLTR